MAVDTYLIDVKDVPAGKAVRVNVDGTCCVACNDNGSFHVADCICPHAGGPLDGADVADGCVTCPVHYWPWDLKTGLTDPNMPELRLKLYACEVRSGRLFANLSQPLPFSFPPTVPPQSPARREQA